MKRVVFCILIFLFIPNFLKADVRYVSKTGTSTPPYMSWETAADSIQKCLDICDNGDTIYVANGTYHESIVVNKSIYLIGMSMDSTVIDGTGLDDLTISSPTDIPIFLLRFSIIGSGKTNAIIVFSRSLVNISYCKLNNANTAIYSRSGGPINNLFITNVIFGIEGGCVYDTCHYNIENNIILQTINNGTCISNNIGGHYKIKNNILIFYYNTAPGLAIYFERVHSAEVTNNIISGFSDGVYIDDYLADTPFVCNNVFCNMTTGIDVYYSAIVRNNIFFNNRIGIYSRSTQWPKVNYNLLWNNRANYSSYGTIIPGDSDIDAYPMFVKDEKPDPTLAFDFHLQKFSPAIDKGDPSILDADGSRSDIGVYGGPYGESYTYNDLAPLQPKNLTAVVDSGKVLLKWKRNSEADTSYYSIYMDSTQNFTVDSTRLLGKTIDTLFTFSSLQINKPYYFKVTATDKQGNQSVPSEELLITITSAENDEPKAISTYQLYINYPNPFNPSTKISYKLKERGYVKLLVYDIKGEVVEVLVNKEQEAGYYETVFDANGLSSGIYLYKLEVTGNGNIPAYTEMKKCVLVK